MTQYLLSVHMVEGEPMPAEDVIAARCTPTSTRSTRRSRRPAPGCSPAACIPPTPPRSCEVQNGEVADHRRPVRRDQGAARRLLDHRGRRPGRRAGVGRQGHGRLPGARSRCALPGRAGGVASVTRRGDRHGRAGLPRGVRPGGRDPDPPLRRHRRRRGGGPGRVRWSPPSAGRRRACRPTPAAWIVTTARNRAIDRFRRESSRYDRYVQAAPARAGRRGDRGRPVSDDRLRLIFTCCHPALAPRGAGRADAAAAGRAADPRDRPRLPRARGDHGPAAGAGQEQDPRREHPVPHPRRRRADRPAAPRALRRLPDLQRGLHGVGRRRARRATTCAPRRSASRACWSS